MKHDLQALKERLPVAEAWTLLGLPGTPRPTCRSPFREDRQPSFSIYDEGRRWKDFSTGEGGDVIDFIARACDLDKAAATRRFLALAGVDTTASFSSTPSRPPQAAAPAMPGTLELPPLRRGTVEEIEAVARSRRLDPAAVSLAQSLHCLAFGQVCGHDCWVLCDSARRVAEARRIDGLAFPATGTLGQRKAHTLRGSSKSWPVGVAVLERLPAFRAIMLVEGGPDYLAALHFLLARDVHDVLPVAMLGRGTGTRIDPRALALLAGRPVRIYPHNDADGGGMAGAELWAAQLHRAGCQVDFYSFAGLLQDDGLPVKDLNNTVRTSAIHLPRLAHLIP